jgi:flagellar motor protein MotB
MSSAASRSVRQCERALGLDPFKNNWELAAARSLELLHLLTTRYEIAESRFTISSYGSIDPRSSNETAEGRANNCRVEILILDESPVSPH